MLEEIFESAKVATTPPIATASTQQKTERNKDSMGKKKVGCKSRYPETIDIYCPMYYLHPLHIYAYALTLTIMRDSGAP